MTHLIENRMTKHAYLIAANANLQVLEVCLELLDDARNDIFLIFDKKSHITIECKEALKSKVKQANFKILDDIIINWGGWTQIEAVLKLLHAANHSNTYYSYIHFFQGSDLPIKNQDEIHAYFDKSAPMNFVSVEKNRKAMAQRKCWYRHIFCHNRFFRKNKFVKALNFGLVEIQKLFGMTINQDVDLYQGSALFSITGECANYVESKADEIERRFRYSLAGDEVFLQSILMASEYRNTLSKIDCETSSNARLIDRTRPDGKNSPHVWRTNEIGTLLSQPEECCFARKFDERVDMTVVSMLADHIKGKNRKVEHNE